MASDFELFLRLLFPRKHAFALKLLQECFHSVDGRPVEPEFNQIMTFFKENNFGGKSNRSLEIKTRNMLLKLQAWGLIAKSTKTSKWYLTRELFPNKLRNIARGYEELRDHGV